ncbi:MAG: hypothetical protein GY765_25300 [bacterium]|nr:hypothetical protein [bacterium]
MLSKGIEIMLVGMTSVFVFLALLVLMVRLTNICLKQFNHWFAEHEEPRPSTIERVMGKNDDIAVAIAAVKSFMKK